MVEVVCPLSDLHTVVADQAPDDRLTESLRSAGARLVVWPSAVSRW